jgi:hypothetical protein
VKVIGQEVKGAGERLDRLEQGVRQNAAEPGVDIQRIVKGSVNENAILD